MSITLEPLLQAIGYAGEAQQIDVVRQLQSAGAFGALPGVEGGLSDGQARAILKNVTFRDDETAVHWLHNAGLPGLAGSLASPANLSTTPLVMVDPAMIKTEAATYQFRANGDGNGVTERGRHHAERWDPILHGDPLLLHERKDGLFVADGHHRLDLANRLNAQGTGPGAMAAVILREADGYTAQDVKIIAAFKNIARLAHSRPDPECMVDAAHVLQEARNADVHRQLLPALDLTQGNLKDADRLSRLGGASLDMVARREVPVEMAAKVADRVSDAPRQDEVMRIIARQLRQHYHLPGHDAPARQEHCSPARSAENHARRPNIPPAGISYTDKALKSPSSCQLTR